MSQPPKPRPVLRQHIRYDTPYNVEGGVLRRNGRDAYDAVLEFFRVCTDWDGHPVRPSVDVRSADQWSPPGWDPAPIHTALADRLGERGSITGGIHLQGSALTYLNREWVIPPEHFDWAVGLVLDRPKDPPNTVPALSMGWTATFRVRGQDGDVLPGQDAMGSPPGSLVSLASVYMNPGKVALTFMPLALPFNEPDEAFLAQVAWMRKHLPIRIAKGAFRLCVIKKDGSGYRFRRIDKNLFPNL